MLLIYYHIARMDRRRIEAPCQDRIQTKRQSRVRTLPGRYPSSTWALPGRISSASRVPRHPLMKRCRTPGPTHAR